MVTSLETLQNFKLWKDFIFHSHNSVQKPLAAGAWDRSRLNPLLQGNRSELLTPKRPCLIHLHTGRLTEKPLYAENQFSLSQYLAHVETARLQLCMPNSTKLSTSEQSLNQRHISHPVSTPVAKGLCLYSKQPR